MRYKRSLRDGGGEMITCLDSRAWYLYSQSYGTSSCWTHGELPASQLLLLNPDLPLNFKAGG